MALKYCPECGNKVPENAKFCPDCGYKLEIPEEPTITQEPEVIEPEVIEEPETTQSRPPIDMVDVKDVKPSKIKSWKVVCIGAVVLIAILCVVFIPKRKEEPVSITQASTETIKETEIETTVAEKKKMSLVTKNIGDIMYLIPEQFNVVEEADDGAMYISETDDVVLILIISEQSGLGKVSKNRIVDEICDNLENGVIEMISEIAPGTHVQNNHGISDLSSGEYVRISNSMTFQKESSLYNVLSEMVCRSGYDTVAFLVSITKPSADSYLAVENQIMNSVRIGESSEVSSTTSSTGVSKEVREFVDGFEAFFNKYVDVMESIASGNNLSAIADYATLLSEYAEWMEKIDEFESKDMTAEDSKYFWDAYARVMSKLTSAGLSDK